MHSDAALAVARACHLGLNAIHELMRFVLSDLDELVLQIPPLCGNEQRSSFPNEVLNERLVAPTTSLEVDTPKNASRLITTAQVVNDRVIGKFIWHLRLTMGGLEYR